MKKVVAIMLIVVLVVTNSVVVFARTINDVVDGSNKDTHDVTATYTKTSSGVIYSVSVSWGNMQFEYSNGTSATWDPVEHKYTGGTADGWSLAAEGTNFIKVINDSNAQVKATYSFTSAPTRTSVTGKITDGNPETPSEVPYTILATAEGTAKGGGPNDTVYLNLDGNPGVTWTGDTESMGTATVTISTP